jgi:hypothetical protein
MKITRKVSGELIAVVIGELTATDIAKIRRNKEFIFDWELEQSTELCKLYLKDDESQILGLLSLKDYPEELRIHINLIEVIKSQVGKTRTLDHIAGCLIAYACALAFSRGYEGFVSLQPKTRLIDLYQDKYGFRQYGRLLAVEYEISKQLIDKYIGDE